jgi:hypothetical protein
MKTMLIFLLCCALINGQSNASQADQSELPDLRQLTHDQQCVILFLCMSAFDRQPKLDKPMYDYLIFGSLHANGSPLHVYKPRTGRSGNILYIPIEGMKNKGLKVKKTKLPTLMHKGEQLTNTYGKNIFNGSFITYVPF